MILNYCLLIYNFYPIHQSSHAINLIYTAWHSISSSSPKDFWKGAASPQQFIIIIRTSGYQQDDLVLLIIMANSAPPRKGLGKGYLLLLGTVEQTQYRLFYQCNSQSCMRNKTDAKRKESLWPPSNYIFLLSCLSFGLWVLKCIKMNYGKWIAMCLL